MSEVSLIESLNKSSTLSFTENLLRLLDVQNYRFLFGTMELPNKENTLPKYIYIDIQTNDYNNLGKEILIGTNILLDSYI